MQGTVQEIFTVSRARIRPVLPTGMRILLRVGSRETSEPWADFVFEPSRPNHRAIEELQRTV